MHEHEIFVFLLAMAALLGFARLLGEGARMLGLPLVVGEITAGILLGPTGLGRLAPGAYSFLLPSGAPKSMIEGYTTVSVVLLLTVAGLEVDLNVVKRHGRSAVAVSLLGMVLPLAGGFVLGWLLPSTYLVQPDKRLVFSIFVGVALSISALPVIAKTLLDLGLFRTDVGLLVMTAAMIDDLFGWLAFSVLLGPMRGGEIDVRQLGVTVGLTAVFALSCLTIGKRLVDRALAALERQADVAGGRVLSFVIVVALLGAAATQAIGVHAVLGGFIVGVTLGEAPRLRERTRRSIQQFVTNVFAPVFFAVVALRVDFVRNFDPGLCIAFVAVASVAKLVGCGFGARLSGMGGRESMAIGFGLNARGAMEIILAILAREAGMLDDRVFVALVFMAIATSLVAGPAMKHLLYGKRTSRAPEPGGTESAAALVETGAFVPALTAQTSARAIEELGVALRTVVGDLVEPALIAVLERELVAPTGLGDEVAIPHAPVEGLARPVVALGLSRTGIDFDAPDGRPAKIVFLLLLPPKAYEREIRVLASLARSVFDEAARESLLDARTVEEAVRCLDAHGQRVSKSAGPGMASLTDL